MGLLSHDGEMGFAADLLSGWAYLGDPTPAVGGNQFESQLDEWPDRLEVGWTLASEPCLEVALAESGTSIWLAASATTCLVMAIYAAARA